MIKNGKHYVYLHKNKNTGKIFYVGIGVLSRAYNFAPHSRGRYWNSYVKSHGKPKVEFYKTGITRAEALEIEKELIAKYGRKAFDNNGILVNLTIGGDGGAGLKGEKNPNYGKPLSEAVRKKLSEAHKGKKLSKEHIEKLRVINTGKKMSPEAIEKTRQANIGKKKNELQMRIFRDMRMSKVGDKHHFFGKHHSEETKRKLREKHLGRKQPKDAVERMRQKHIEMQYSAKKIIDYGSYNVFNSIKEMGEHYGVSLKLASQWVRGVCCKYKKGQFEYA